MFERSKFKYYLSLVIFAVAFILGTESNLEMLIFYQQVIGL